MRALGNGSSRKWRWSAILWGVLLVGVARGELTEAHRQQLVKLNADLRKAGELFTQGKHREAGEAIKGVQEGLTKIAQEAGPESARVLTEIHKRVVRAHALLELEGIELPQMKPLEELVRPEGAPGAPAPSNPAPKPGQVSFREHVAPILVGKCGRCHVDNARGQFSLATFEALKKGPPAGVVFFPGDPIGSRLIEVIESGDMPRGGQKLTAEELTTLKKWIEQGATFDGPDPTANLKQLAPNASTAPVAVTVGESTGKETVSFARDIAPVLAEKCANCHGNARQPGGAFNLTNFTALLRGGDSGPPLQPGKGMESLIVQKLNGTAPGERMPKDLPPLPDEVIAKFVTWINEGATFDGPDRGQHVKDVAAVAKAKGSTHAELSAARAARADEQWRLGMPGIAQTKVETANYLLVGDIGEATLAKLGQVAEEAAPKVAAVFGAASDEPLVKGRLTLFVFNQRYDYSEFGKMVEKRDLPTAWRGHWMFNVVDAYAAVIAPRGEESSEGLVAQQLAAVYVASQGKFPSWFSEGSGRVVASRLAPDDPRVKTWETELPRVLGSMAAADDFLTGKLPTEDADIASHSFVTFLMKDAKKYRAVLDQVRAGQDFVQVFSATYGGSPGQVAEAWVRSAARQRPRR